MAWYNEEYPETLNYMIVGNRHAGHELLQASLAVHPQMVCHGDLLHPDLKVRQQEHEDYFGDSGQSDWYHPKLLSVEQYLNNKIFDNAIHGEKAIGVKLDYSNFVKHDLWDYTEQCCRSGDFCLLHVTRNPVACYYEYQGALKRKGFCDHSPFERHNWLAHLEPRDLVAFVRSHLASEAKMNRLCGDRAVIAYHELVLDFKSVLQKVCDFLDVRYSAACIPNQKRLKIQNIKSRIGNWEQLQEELPSDVKDELNSPTLF